MIAPFFYFLYAIKTGPKVPSAETPAVDFFPSSNIWHFTVVSLVSSNQDIIVTYVEYMNFRNEHQLVAKVLIPRIRGFVRNNRISIYGDGIKCYRCDEPGLQHVHAIFISNFSFNNMSFIENSIYIVIFTSLITIAIESCNLGDFYDLQIVRIITCSVITSDTKL